MSVESPLLLPKQLLAVAASLPAAAPCSPLSAGARQCHSASLPATGFFFGHSPSGDSSVVSGMESKGFTTTPALPLPPKTNRESPSTNYAAPAYVSSLLPRLDPPVFELSTSTSSACTAVRAASTPSTGASVISSCSSPPMSCSSFSYFLSLYDVLAVPVAATAPVVVSWALSTEDAHDRLSTAAAETNRVTAVNRSASMCSHSCPQKQQEQQAATNLCCPFSQEPQQQQTYKSSNLCALAPAVAGAPHAHLQQQERQQEKTKKHEHPQLCQPSETERQREQEFQQQQQRWAQQQQSRQPLQAPQQQAQQRHQHQLGKKQRQHLQQPIQIQQQQQQEGDQRQPRRQHLQAQHPFQNEQQQQREGHQQQRKRNQHQLPQQLAERQQQQQQQEADQQQQETWHQHHVQKQRDSQRSPRRRQQNEQQDLCTHHLEEPLLQQQQYGHLPHTFGRSVICQKMQQEQRASSRQANQHVEQQQLRDEEPQRLHHLEQQDQRRRSQQPQAQHLAQHEQHLHQQQQQHQHQQQQQHHTQQHGPRHHQQQHLHHHQQPRHQQQRHHQHPRHQQRHCQQQERRQDVDCLNVITPPPPLTPVARSVTETAAVFCSYGPRVLTTFAQQLLIISHTLALLLVAQHLSPTPPSHYIADLYSQQQKMLTQSISQMNAVRNTAAPQNDLLFPVRGGCHSSNNTQLHRDNIASHSHSVGSGQKQHKFLSPSFSSATSLPKPLTFSLNSAASLFSIAAYFPSTGKGVIQEPYTDAAAAAAAARASRPSAAISLSSPFSFSLSHSHKTLPDAASPSIERTVLSTSAASATPHTDTLLLTKPAVDFPSSTSFALSVLPSSSSSLFRSASRVTFPPSSSSCSSSPSQSSSSACSSPSSAGSPFSFLTSSSFSSSSNLCDSLSSSSPFPSFSSPFPSLSSVSSDHQIISSSAASELHALLLQLAAVARLIFIGVAGSCLLLLSVPFSFLPYFRLCMKRAHNRVLVNQRHWFTLYPSPSLLTEVLPEVVFAAIGGSLFLPYLLYVEQCFCSYLAEKISLVYLSSSFSSSFSLSSPTLSCVMSLPVAASLAAAKSLYATNIYFPSIFSPPLSISLSSLIPSSAAITSSSTKTAVSVSQAATAPSCLAQYISPIVTTTAAAAGAGAGIGAGAGSGASHPPPRSATRDGRDRGKTTSTTHVSPAVVPAKSRRLAVPVAAVSAVSSSPSLPLRSFTGTRAQLHNSFSPAYFAKAPASAAPLLSSADPVMNVDLRFNAATALPTGDPPPPPALRKSLPENISDRRRKPTRPNLLSSGGDLRSVGMMSASLSFPAPAGDSGITTGSPTLSGATAAAAASVLPNPAPHPPASGAVAASSLPAGVIPETNSTQAEAASSASYPSAAASAGSTIPAVASTAPFPVDTVSGSFSAGASAASSPPVATGALSSTSIPAAPCVIRECLAAAAAAPAPCASSSSSFSAVGVDAAPVADASSAAASAPSPAPAASVAAISHLADAGSAARSPADVSAASSSRATDSAATTPSDSVAAPSTSRVARAAGPASAAATSAAAAPATAACSPAACSPAACSPPAASSASVATITKPSSVSLSASVAFADVAASPPGGPGAEAFFSVSLSRMGGWIAILLGISACGGLYGFFLPSFSSSIISSTSLSSFAFSISLFFEPPSLPVSSAADRALPGPHTWVTAPTSYAHSATAETGQAARIRNEAPGGDAAGTGDATRSENAAERGSTARRSNAAGRRRGHAASEVGAAGREGAANKGETAGTGNAGGAANTAGRGDAAEITTAAPRREAMHTGSAKEIGDEGEIGEGGGIENVASTGYAASLRDAAASSPHPEKTFKRGQQTGAPPLVLLQFFPFSILPCLAFGAALCCWCSFRHYKTYHRILCWRERCSCCLRTWFLFFIACSCAVAAVQLSMRTLCLTNLCSPANAKIITPAGGFSYVHGSPLLYLWCICVPSAALLVRAAALVLLVIPLLQLLLLYYSIRLGTGKARLQHAFCASFSLPPLLPGSNRTQQGVLCSVSRQSDRSRRSSRGYKTSSSGSSSHTTSSNTSRRCTLLKNMCSENGRNHEKSTVHANRLRSDLYRYRSNPRRLTSGTSGATFVQKSAATSLSNASSCSAAGSVKERYALTPGGCNTVCPSAAREVSLVLLPGEASVALVQDDGYKSSSALNYRLAAEDTWETSTALISAPETYKPFIFTDTRTSRHTQSRWKNILPRWLLSSETEGDRLPWRDPLNGRSSSMTTLMLTRAPADTHNDAINPFCP